IYLINNGAGVSFMPRYDYDDIDIGKNLIYIEKPFESIVSFQRNIYFKTDRFSELMDICSILSE
uniref:hypothetical protein n=1 Tax=Aeromonas sp. HMWF016 TaxID=2056852 RepID=UPI001C638F5C